MTNGTPSSHLPPSPGDSIAIQKQKKEKHLFEATKYTQNTVITKKITRQTYNYTNKKQTRNIYTQTVCSIYLFW